MYPVVAAAEEPDELTPHLAVGVNKVPSPEGKFIKSVGEEYKVVKRGRKYHGCDKRER